MRESTKRRETTHNSSTKRAWLTARRSNSYIDAIGRSLLSSPTAAVDDATAESYASAFGGGSDTAAETEAVGKRDARELIDLDPDSYSEGFQTLRSSALPALRMSSGGGSSST